MYEGQFETFPDESYDGSKLLSRQKRCAVACTCIGFDNSNCICPGGCPCRGIAPPPCTSPTSPTSHTTNKDYPVITTVSLYL